MKSHTHKKASRADAEKRFGLSGTESQTGDISKCFPIVGVGASAGGLEALTLLLQSLPQDLGMGFVLVQHLDPEHESVLAHLLARATTMPVCEATNNQRVHPNQVYVIPPNTKLHIAKGVLKLLPREKSRAPARAIDYFLESLAQDQRERAIGVILSGTGTDGTLGLEAIKAEGGITFAQDDSAKYDSMPRNAAAAGCVDFVFKPDGIAAELVRIAKHPYLTGRPSLDDIKGEAIKTPLPARGRGARKHAALLAPTAEISADEAGFKKVLLVLRNHSGVDFSLYKATTIQRRIVRRVMLTRQSTLEDYGNFLKGNTKELDSLYSDVLISVTSFFRNREAFEVLKHKVFPKLLEKGGNQPVRIWVLGCSTGQEAYSVAMAFIEASENSHQGRKLQVFATDLNDAHLGRARNGLYTKAIEEDVSPERLRRFFVEEDAGYRVGKPLREMVIFARQNLVSDPPFSRMDLISCRNLLIYLESDLQKKAISTFHYALDPGGYLLLGASESISGFTDLFDTLDKKQKIYFKKGALNRAFSMPSRKERGKTETLGRKAPLVEKSHAHQLGSVSGELDSQREADRISVNQFAPPGVLVSEELQILQFRGPTGSYLQPPATGKASLDLIKMAREGLALPLRAALNQAKKQNKTVRKENVRVRQGAGSRLVSLEIIPLKNLKQRCFLILFHGAQRAQAAAAKDSPPAPGNGPAAGKREESRIALLETELAENHDYVQALQEQHEAAHEELQASNEEVQSANEELQSINEELETSKEELESANEELVTTNEEMVSRNAELNLLNADLGNLQDTTKLPILLLGRDLIIRRFSAPAEKIFNLITNDVGRPLTGVRHNLVVPRAGAIPAAGDSANSSDDGKETEGPSVEELIRKVIDMVKEGEWEVHDKEGRWYSMRVRPYITVDNKIDGAVLVLVDITELKHKEQETKAARDYAQATIQTSRDPLLILRADLRVNTANEAFYKTFKTSPEQTENQLIYELGSQQWNIPKLRVLLEDVLPRNSFFNDFEVTVDFPEIGQRTLLLNARRLKWSGGAPQMILLAIEDVTERQRADLATAFLAAIVNSSDDAIIGQDLQGIITSWNHGAERLFGHSMAEAIGRSVHMLIPRNREGEETKILSRLGQGRRVENFETFRLHKNGTFVEVSLTVSPVTNAFGEVIGASKIARDITERKRAAERVRVSEIRFRRLFEAAHEGVLMLDSVSRKITDVNPFMAQLLGVTRQNLVGQELWQIGLLNDEQASHAVFRELQQKGMVHYEDLPLQIKSGEKREIEVVASLYEEDGKQVIQCTIRDITERNRSAEALRQSEERFRTLFDLGPVAIYSCDANGLIREFNGRAAELWGREPEAGDTEERFCGSFKLIRMDGTIMPHDECTMAEVLEGKIEEVKNEEIFIERPDATKVAVIVNIRALKDSRGRITGAINCFYDITKRKQVEEMLQLAQAQLADRASQLEQVVNERTAELLLTNRQLEAFVYSIAHDLRAPLRAMQGFASLLVEEAGAALNKTCQDYAHRIDKSAQLLDAMLSELLGFSRVSQQHLELSPINLETTVELTISGLQDDIQEKKAQVESRPPWPSVMAHEATLAQALTNLLSNALKFVPPGVSPLIKLRAEERGEFVRVWVEDNGIGIAPDHQEQIFRLFTRLRGEKYPGTGIGLAIVRKGIERMGGNAGVESAINEGSRFWFDLKKAPKSPARAAKISPAN